ncbi:MAG: hypothetical protein SVW57_06605 [Thermodesulfobacteriota bacterium]|nr:hypothetical protein [Thermodesulfobacteriota bacterium]
MKGCTNKSHRMYHCNLMDGMFSFLASSESGRHLLNARKEILLSIKSLLEREIERAEELTKVKVEKVDIT